MKNFTLIVLMAVFASCTQNNSTNMTEQKAPNMDSLKNELMNADKSWNDASLQKGYYHSRVDYVDDNGIELSVGEMPLVGKAAITDYAAKNSDSTLKVQWTSLRAEVSSSGDLGCTYGSYSTRMKDKDGKDTTFYGAYVTVWKKQADGSWKFLADAGVNTPQQVQ